MPKALPSIFGGLKVGMGQAVVGATVGEFIAAESGLGYLQLISQVRLDTPLLFAAVVMLSILGVLLFNIVGWVERLALPWSRVATQMRVGSAQHGSRRSSWAARKGSGAGVPIMLRNVSKRYRAARGGEVQALAEIDLSDRRRRIRVHCRPERLRQEHVADADFRADPADNRRDRGR